jgi:hypothetical protein
MPHVRLACTTLDQSPYQIQVRNIRQWLSLIFVNSFCLVRDEKLQKRDICVSSVMATVMAMA